MTDELYNAVRRRVCALTFLAGIAVSAGELDEQQAEELIETRQQLKVAHASLEAVRQENQELRARITSLQSAQVVRDGS